MSVSDIGLISFIMGVLLMRFWKLGRTNWNAKRTFSVNYSLKFLFCKFLAIVGLLLIIENWVGSLVIVSSLVIGVPFGFLLAFVDIKITRENFKEVLQFNTAKDAIAFYRKTGLGVLFKPAIILIFIISIAFTAFFITTNPLAILLSAYAAYYIHHFTMRLTLLPFYCGELKLLLEAEEGMLEKERNQS